jgi:hypothetical protein
VSWVIIGMLVAKGGQHMDLTDQLDAVEVLLRQAEVIPDTLEVELYLYRERLTAANQATS